MSKIIFDVCLCTFFLDDKEITHETAKALIEENGNPFDEELSKEGTPIIVWPIYAKEFFFKDKTGRGITNTLIEDDIYKMENELGDNDTFLHFFAEAAEIGDEWEIRTMKIIRIK